jgi:RES domain-containing protein
MRLAKLAKPWSGDGLRHRPKNSIRSVLDDVHLGQASNNRWSELGCRAYYFASDVGLVTAEHARHIAIDVPADHTVRLERSVFRVPITLESVLDLTDRPVVAAMGADPLNDWVLDLGRTQVAAAYLRSQVNGLQGLLVPSVAFLDQHERRNIVVFRDAIDPAEAFGEPAFELDIILAAAGA